MTSILIGLGLVLAILAAAGLMFRAHRRAGEAIERDRQQAETIDAAARANAARIEAARGDHSDDPFNRDRSA